MLHDELAGEITKKPSIHQEIAQRGVSLRQLELIDCVSSVFEQSVSRTRRMDEGFELRERQRPEAEDIVLVGDAVHLNMVPQRTPWGWFSRLGAVTAVVVVNL